MCIIRTKTQAATYILTRLLDNRPIADETNVKLMKLIYLVYIRFIGLHEGQALVPQSAFAGFRFTALPRGGVEMDIYENLDYVRSEVEACQRDDDQTPNPADFILLPPGNFTNERIWNETEMLDQAINDIADNFANMETNEIVDFVHTELPKWGKTTLFEQMKFNGDYTDEVEALNAKLVGVLA